jgi:hypothetical protein
LKTTVLTKFLDSSFSWSGGPRRRSAEVGYFSFKEGNAGFKSLLAAKAAIV